MNKQVNALKEARRAIADVLEFTTSDKKTISCQVIRNILCEPYVVVCQAITEARNRQSWGLE